MADDLRKVRAGEQLDIPAAAYNAFIDAAEDMKRRRHQASRKEQVEPRQTGIVLV